MGEGNHFTSHQLNDMRRGLVEDNLEMLRVALFKLLLQETATMLIFAQGINLLAWHSLQVIVHETIRI